MNYFQKGGKNETLTSADLKEGLYTALDKLGKTPVGLFRGHDWREGIVTLGEVPGEFVSKVSEGKVDYPWPAQVDKLLVEGDFDLILSIGQVVPHEVVGMANYNKNIFIGTGGTESINKSIYRTRMAMAAGGELIVLAPGLAEFGEDKEIYYISNPGMGLWSWKQRFHSPGFPTTSS